VLPNFPFANLSSMASASEFSPITVVAAIVEFVNVKDFELGLEHSSSQSSTDVDRVMAVSEISKLNRYWKKSPLKEEDLEQFNFTELLPGNMLCTVINSGCY
jgi:hypothetical protein